MKGDIVSQPIEVNANVVVEAYRNELAAANERAILAQASVTMLQQENAALRQQLAQQSAEPVPKGSKK